MADEFGIVIVDLGGGDFAIYFVDRMRWEAVCAAHAAIEETDGWQGRLLGAVIAVVEGDGLGRMLTVVHAQTWTIAKEWLQVRVLLGILVVR